MQGNAVCSGAFVAEDRIATAYHCVLAGGRVRVQTSDGREGVARVIDQRVGWDLALLETIDIESSVWLERRTTPLQRGETVYTVGHPYGAREASGFLAGTLRWSLSEGIVSNVGPKAVQFTTPVNPGNSGGPLFDDDGRLVGVVSRRIDGDGMGFAARVSGLAPMIAEPAGHAALIGGTFHVEPLLSTYELTISFGVAAQVNVRDRLVLDALVTHPLNKRWDAVRFGRVEWMSSEFRGGLRQRLFSGGWTLRIDALAGVGVVQSVTGAIAEGTSSSDLRVQIRPEDGSPSLVPLVGVALGSGQWTSDISVNPTSGDLRLLIRYAWPGRVGMF